MKSIKVGNFSTDSIIQLSTKLKEIFPDTQWKISQIPEKKQISALSEPFFQVLCLRYQQQVNQYSETIRSSVSIQGGRRERTLTLENITLESLQTFKEKRDLQTFKKNNIIEDKTKLVTLENSPQQVVNDQQQLSPTPIQISADNESEEGEEGKRSADSHP